MLLNEILWLIKHFKMNSELVQLFSNSGYITITDGNTRIDICEQYVTDMFVRFMWVYKILDDGRFTKMISTPLNEYMSTISLSEEKEG